MSKKPNTARCLSALTAACMLSIALPALPVMAQDDAKTKPAASSEKIDVEFDVSIPNIEAIDSNVDDATLKDVLSGKIVDNAEALAGLTASSITVPEIEVTITGQQDGEDHSASVVLTDLVLTDVTDGVAGSVSLSATDMTTSEGTFNVGAISAADFNIGLLLGLYGLVDSQAQAEPEVIYRDFSAEGSTLVTEEMTCSVGAVTGEEFKARPLGTSFVDMIAMIEELDEEPEDMDPAALGRFMSLYADMITSFETSEVYFDGLNCRGVNEDGKRMVFSLGDMTMGAITAGIYPAITMNDFELAIKGEGSFSLENFTIKPMDMSNLIATLKSVPEAVDDLWFEANVRNLFPQMEGFALTGLDIDIPDPDLEGQRITVSVGDFDLTLADYVNGIPTDTEMSASNIQAAIPEDTGDETLEQLRSLGVTDIDLGFRVATVWNEETSTIDIEEVSVNGADLGTVTLAGTIANATASLFDIDSDAALAAAMSVTVTALDLDIVDEGLTEIAFAAVAQNEGGDPERLRSIYADLAKGTVISSLIGMAGAMDVSTALADFIAGRASTLHIGVEGKDEAGVGIEDLMNAETDPKSLLDKVNITATAE